MQLLEMVVWDDWQPAFWTLLQPWDILHMAVVSDIVMVCLSRKSKTDTRLRCLTTGW